MGEVALAGESGSPHSRAMQLGRGGGGLLRIEARLGAVEIRERAAGVAGLHVVPRQRDVDPRIVRIDLECTLVTPARAGRVAELVRLEAFDHEPLARAKL